MTTGVVDFDYALWAARYPDLAGSVGAPLAGAYWSEAGLYCDNTACSQVADATPGGRRAMLLGMVTAHIAKLNATINGQVASDLVGRISSATEGSVTVAAQADYPPGSAQWFNSTRYGAAFWAATAANRTMRYVPGPVRSMNPGGWPWR